MFLLLLSPVYKYGADSDCFFTFTISPALFLNNAQDCVKVDTFRLHTNYRIHMYRRQNTFQRYTLHCSSCFVISMASSAILSAELTHFS